MAISLFHTFAYADIVGICKAEFKDTDGFVNPSSAYNDTTEPVYKDGTKGQYKVNLILITPTESDGEYQFEEQYVELDSNGIAVVKATDETQWAMKFRMFRVVTEQEVREHQVRQLISR